MVKSCCAVGCANRFAKGGGKSFYKFPTNQLRRAKWIAALKRKNWQPNASSWVCSDHFVRFKKSDDPLSPDFVPSVFSDVGRVNGEKAYVKFDRHKARRHAASKPTAQPEDTCHGNHEPVLTGESDCNADKEIEEESAPRDSCSSDSVEPASPAQPELTEASSHVDNSAEQENDDLRRRLALLQATVAQLEEDKCQLNGQLQEQKSAISALTVKVQHLEATVKHQKSEAAMSSIISGFKSNDDMMRYETGLPSFAVLEKVFAFAGKDIPDHHRAALPSFAQFIIVLMKLRLNLHDQDLAHRFGISQSTVSKYFHKWIHVLYDRLQPLIIWPERSELYRTMPLEFRGQFGKCICIIDCFEVFCERPHGLMARAQTFSNYKHHNTVKFLIGITPQGTISFISKGWGGRTSDKYITEHCGLLDKLLPGDQLMADRGFTVSDAVGLHCAELVIPPFTRGKKQLSRISIEKARKLSRLRIHVERVIGNLRQKYTILQSTLPVNMLMSDASTGVCTIDKIVLVCSALCNCCDSVVPFQ
ncbi:uncharacterized protein LOC135822650 [Sycon ciliatum]|uniref:uncharacterized protein LOC135822650 n=1 Tax=Sycon ciliatum TaxID=27933 RepID=UPI0031F71968